MQILIYCREDFRDLGDAAWVVVKANKFSTYGLSTPAHPLMVGTEGQGAVTGIPQDTLLIRGETVGLFAGVTVDSSVEPANDKRVCPQ